MSDEQIDKFVYWVPAEAIDAVTAELTVDGYCIQKTLGSQCEVLKCSGKRLGLAEPAGFSRMCKRQGSWYRSSAKNGQYLLVADHRLRGSVQRYLDATMAVSDFEPESLPDLIELKEVVDTPEYQTTRPDEWQKYSLLDRVMMKIMFTLTGFWGRGENLSTAWLGHQANHANFLAKRFTADIDGEAVAYSVTENAGVCSSCVEFFNLVSDDSRKLVRSCPGSITLSGAARGVFYDVRPVGVSESFGTAGVEPNHSTTG